MRNSNKVMQDEVDYEILPLCVKVAASHANGDFTPGLLLEGRTLNGLNLSNIPFQDATIINCKFINCNMKGAVFANSTIRGCKFEDCVLTGAEFSESNISSSFENCNLRNSAIRSCDFGGSIFLYSDFTGASVRSIKPPMFFHECNLDFRSASTAVLEYIKALSEIDIARKRCIDEMVFWRERSDEDKEGIN